MTELATSPTSPTSPAPDASPAGSTQPGAAPAALTLADAAAALRDGTTTSVELVQAAIAVADAHDEAVGMFLARYTETALAAAEAADAALAAGADVGPLHGLPLGIKDIITTAEGPSTAQSLVFDSSSMSGDAVVVSRLREAGGIMMGKLTTMEFAIGAPDPDKPFPIPRNPWNLDHWAGGSSSGSGSSVAAGAVLAALGTDTAGSIRIPAAFCGVSGLMGTFGRVPKSGCVPLGYSLDHIGPLARSARDCALVFDVLAGPHPSDPTTLDVPTTPCAAGLTGDLTGVRIGADRLAWMAGEREDPAVPGAFDEALAALARRGADIIEIDLPLYAELSAAEWVVMLSEAFAYHRPDLQERWADYGAPTREILATAVFYSAADQVQAQRVRRLGAKALAGAYEDVDLIVTPTASCGALSFAAMAERGVLDAIGAIHTAYWDITGNPVLSVPMGFTAEGLPLGLQIAGRPFEEALLLRAGDAYQRESTWHLQAPPLGLPATG
ncbi:Glutamyl-tRNA(Gln) amidotransferase subunit A [Frankia sp. AiPs1]|uniref:amidase n=1 Tax=Frankia sp. AiPa1 TaxID=573492 RepID=UPI00202B513A|nr:amidase [Frankia sp. AiPa1]MCL9759221.1 amidase [Frankia sp. AiPa1]